MLTEVQNDILDALDTIAAFRTCGVWQGDLDELLKQVQKLPAAHVVLVDGKSTGRISMPYTKAPMGLAWDIIIVYECLKDRKVATDQGYGLIEAVFSTVGGLKTQGSGLVPEGFDLLEVTGGKAAYALRFNITREI